MLRTVLLEDENENVKTFSFSRNMKTASLISGSNKQNILNSIHKETRSKDHTLYRTDGVIELKNSNSVYMLSFLSVSTDIVLPKSPKPMDYVVLTYDPTDVAQVISKDNLTKIKLYGNGKNIMGLNEYMKCDVPFYTLRLVFVDDAYGWVIC